MKDKPKEPLECLIEALDGVIKKLVNDDSPEAFERRQRAKVTLGRQFVKTREDGQCWFEAQDVLKCLELLADWKKDLPRFLHEHNRQKLLETFLVMELAVICAWAIRTRRAAARFTAAFANKFVRVGDQPLGLGERLQRLVLVARRETIAENEEQALMARLVMRVLEGKIEHLIVGR